MAATLLRGGGKLALCCAESCVCPERMAGCISSANAPHVLSTEGPANGQRRSGTAMSTGVEVRSRWRFAGARSPK